jgi:hypothetical protein
MARIMIVLALTAAVLSLSGTGSPAQSGPPNFSKDELMSMCRARTRGNVAKCECILKTMHKYLTNEHISIIFWLNYDNPPAAKAYLSALRKRDPQAGRKAYNASYPGWIEAQKTCQWL